MKQATVKDGETAYIGSVVRYTTGTGNESYGTMQVYEGTVRAVYSGGMRGIWLRVDPFYPPGSARLYDRVLAKQCELVA